MPVARHGKRKRENEKERSVRLQRVLIVLLNIVQYAIVTNLHL